MPSIIPRLLWLLAVSLLLAGCSSPVYEYRYVPGRTAVLENGYAVAPPGAPEAVKAAIAAGNRINGYPYRYGGGHKRGIDTAYDCSGAVSFVLSGAGRLKAPTTSKALRKYGASGEGEWISIYARRNHSFIVVAGLRFDTGWTGEEEGPRWTTRSRPAPGSVIRHPPGL